MDTCDKGPLISVSSKGKSINAPHPLPTHLNAGTTGSALTQFPQRKLLFAEKNTIHKTHSKTEIIRPQHK
jgi:hypothetical protein